MGDGLACPHGEHPAVCVECFEGVPPERHAPAWGKIGGPFRAAYTNLDPACGCGWPIEEGELIQRWDKPGSAFPDRTAYTHARCRP